MTRARIVAAPARKGARRAADIPADILAELEQGGAPSVTLVEILAVNQARLLRSVFPALPAQVHAEALAACELGVLKRMAAIAALLREHGGERALAVCAMHVSDTVRGWACFMLGSQPGQDIPARLAAMLPFADDPHFGVREWAWMALRPHLAADLDEGVARLVPWTASPSERVRRYASEVLRPRGVWCAHIPALKALPSRALPLLAPLRADASAYVQDSVGNWLNDAAKDQPDWVRSLCAIWEKESPGPETARICRLARRSLA